VTARSPFKVLFAQSLPPPAQNLLERTQRLDRPPTPRRHHRMDQPHRPPIHRPTGQPPAVPPLEHHHPHPRTGADWTRSAITAPRPEHAPTHTHPTPTTPRRHHRRTPPQPSPHRRPPTTLL